MEGRLGRPESKAMKLLTTSFFTLLLIGSAGGPYGQGFEETKRLIEHGDSEFDPPSTYRFMLA